jgi:hypothetical protein
MRTPNEIEIQRIVTLYKKSKEENPDLHIEFCKNQKTLAKAIIVAAQSINWNNRIHNHQKRVGRRTLNEFAEHLCTFKRQIAKAKNFDDLYGIVEGARIEGIGRLVIYDTAHRIGFFRNIFPEKIYLHSGTRKGAKNLLHKLPRKEYLYPNELPISLQRPDLQPWELEDILCIYFKGKRKVRV